MMNQDKQTINKLNWYLTEYVSEKRTHNTSIKDIFDKPLQEGEIINFHSDWNYLMSLLEIIEVNHLIENTICSRNYFKMQPTNDDASIQEKGVNKLEAVFKVCVQFLSANWKTAPIDTRSIAPFDKDDLS